MSLIWIAVYEFVLARFGRLPEYGILSLEISGELSEDGQEGAFPPWLREPPTDFLSLVSLLRWARDDEKLRGVLVRCGPLDVSWARIQSLRRSLIALRSAGKKVWIHLDSGGLPEYYLASVADRVSVSPAGSLDIVGIASESMFFLDALDKFGVRAEVVQMGSYKSAGESFTRRGMSDANREMMESLIDDLYGQIVVDLAGARSLGAEEIKALIDKGPFLAAEAAENGLVDVVQYFDEAQTCLQEALDDAAVIEEDDYGQRQSRVARRRILRADPHHMAVVHVNGNIKMEDGSGPLARGRGASAASLGKALREIGERDDIEAVVLRVSSPGGSGLASDLIWHELVRVAEKKPLLVSFGDVAASGGYFVALAGRKVFAEPGTVTGSIGVIAGKANLRGLYEKVGVHKDSVSRGAHAAMYSDFIPLGDSERERIRDEAQAFYNDFVGKVANGRNLAFEEAENVARGRVWTGRQAWSRGLVDELGGFEEAFEQAKREIGLAVDAPVTVERFPKSQSFWRTALGRRLGGTSELFDPWGVLSEVPFVSSERVWAWLPLSFKIR